MELYKKYRPKTFNEVMGQSAAVTTLEAFIEQGNVPHTLLFSGVSGAGKTSMARIMKEALGCSDHDFQELNCADLRGIDDARDIIRSMGFAPVGGKCRIWLLDEVHFATQAWFQSMLKALEDTPQHVYFILCTTDPQKLPTTIRTRCTEIKINPLSDMHLERLLKRVTRSECKDLPEDARDAIIQASNGSARMALVLLDKVLDLPEEEMLEAITAAEKEQNEVIELARQLLNGKGLTGFNACCKILKGLEDDPEKIRHTVLGYAKTVMLSGKSVDRAYLMIDSFKNNFFDSKMAGVVAACYEVFLGEE